MLSAWRIANNQLRTTQILSVRTESPTVKTFTFKDRRCARAKPGQFLMLWIPGVDEIPLSVAGAEPDGVVAVAVRNVGEATQALHRKKSGDIVGVRGPFGNSFTSTEGNVLLVGGGTGIAPLLFLVKRLAGNRFTFILGAKTRDELLFVTELGHLCRKGLIAATEDGSYGRKCLATEPLESLLEEERFDLIYTCGPEQMMRRVFDEAEKHDTRLEASLERLMRCSVGLCGSCIIGRYRVCKDGPVFSSRRLREVRKEFGELKRDFDGKKTSLT